MAERFCWNCRHNIRTGDISNRECHCEIDGHWIGYVQCFEGWCRRWAMDRWDTTDGQDGEQNESRCGTLPCV